MTAPANPNHLALIAEEPLCDDGLLKARHHGPLKLPVPPDAVSPAWPRVMPLVVNHPAASIRKLLGTLRHLKRLVVHHQLFIAGNMKPCETALDVPA
jgi:hypothetical protein